MPSGPYSVQVIDPPFDTDLSFRSVDVFQINDAGQVLGRLANKTGGQPFLLDVDGSYLPLAVPGASSTVAQQLNGAGEVIGRYADDAGAHAFAYADGTYNEVAVPGAESTIAVQISGNGLILVQYADDTGRHWAIDDNGTFTTLAVPGADSTAVRTYYPLVPGGGPVVNDAGQAVGTYADGPGVAGTHAFLYDGNGGYATLAVPNAYSTTATEINGAGQVLGYYEAVPNGPLRYFVYSDGAYATIAPPGAPDINAAVNVVQINDAGQVAGTYEDAAGTHVFLETNGDYVAVPSPFDTPPPGGDQPATEGDGAVIDTGTLLPAAHGQTYFTQLSNAGDVLGYTYKTGTGFAPFVFSGGVSTLVAAPGGSSSNGLGINDLGQVIGTFPEGKDTRAFLATPLGDDGGAADGSAASDLGAAVAGMLLPAEGGPGVTLGAADPGALRA